jgi:hypothetical protein
LASKPCGTCGEQLNNCYINKQTKKLLASKLQRSHHQKIKKIFSQVIKKYENNFRDCQ